MGKVIFVACTNVGKGMIEEIMNNPNIKQTEIVGVVNIKPSVGVNKANYYDYIDITSKYNIPLFYCNNINDDDCLTWIEGKKPDIIIQTGWSQYFKKKILELPKYGCIGEHPAPLPKGRGAACINWAIITGETDWGDTFFEMVSEYDKGKVYCQNYFRIENYDTVKTVYDKVEGVARKAIAEHIDEWSNGNLVGFTQNDTNATNYHKRTPEMGEFSFKEMPCNEVHNFVRGQTHPYPGAFIFYKNKKVFILKTSPTNNISKNEVGEILNINDFDGSISIVCKDKKIIKVYRVKPENKEEMWAIDYFKTN